MSGLHSLFSIQHKHVHAHSVKKPRDPIHPLCVSLKLDMISFDKLWQKPEHDIIMAETDWLHQYYTDDETHIMQEISWWCYCDVLCGIQFLCASLYCGILITEQLNVSFILKWTGPKMDQLSISSMTLLSSLTEKSQNILQLLTQF